MYLRLAISNSLSALEA